MIVTEEEAKTKRCQETFGSGPVSMTASAPYYGGYGAAGGFAVPAAPAMCIGSACMAWRWGEGERDGVGMFQGVSAPTKGYCGKAGKP